MNELESDFRQTGDRFIKALEQFDDASFNKVPFEGSWTAAQVADHIRQSVEGALESVLEANEPAKRMKDEKTEELRTIFLNYDIQMKSPEFILPTNDPVVKEEMISSLEATWAALAERIQSDNLSKLYGDFEFPGMGKLTAYEWLMFAMFHTQRHTQQVKRIFEALHS